MGLQAELAHAWMTSYDLARRLEGLESLLDDFVTDGVARPAIRHMLAATIDVMSESQIRSVLGAVTQMPDPDLDRVRDLRAYSTRLAEIAANGVLYEEDGDPLAGEIVFTSELRRGDSASFAQSEFGLDQDRIYANFETVGYPGSRVLVKWSHVETGRIHLLQNHLISDNDDNAWVWLEPDGRWQEGRYRVQVFSSDELVELARGGYTI